MKSTGLTALENEILIQRAAPAVQVSSYLLSGLFTGQCILGAEKLQDILVPEVRHCLSGSSQLQPSPAHSAADLKSLFPDGCSSSYSNYQESNMLASIFHHYSTHQE